MSNRLGVCLNRSKGWDEDTFSCSYQGQLVTRGCCEECYALLHETERQKLEREIKLNEKIINYHQKCIGDLRMENFKLIAKKETLPFEREQK
jgi:hypothetical protein